jgi:hypothetical protein
MGRPTSGETRVTEFRDLLVWDKLAGEIRDGETRYILMRADALMGLFRLLPDEMRKPRSMPWGAPSQNMAAVPRAATMPPVGAISRIS